MKLKCLYLQDLGHTMFDVCDKRADILEFQRDECQVVEPRKVHL